MLSRSQVEFYHEHGYVVAEGVLDRDMLAGLRRTVDEIVAAASGVARDTDVYDLEDTHRPEAPRVRRIKSPHKHFPYFWELARHPRVTAPIAQLIGENIRLHGTKLNMKSAGYGAPVEWHQDWAFYPHTNDDILATGLLLDDMDEHNGAVLFLPGTHRGPTYDHHHAGAFVGAIDPQASGLDFAQAVKVTAPAGAMTLHHVRLVHGSGLNRTNRPRRLLLHEYTAADAWPLAGQPWQDFAEFDGRIVRGQGTIEPRVVPCPIRIPQPPTVNPTSIYNIQKSAGARYFETYTDRRPAK